MNNTAGALAIRDDQNMFDDRQIAALAQLGVENAPMADLAVFLHQCQRTQLDPFARQIYLIGRRSQGGMKYTIQTGIDGFRVVARRSADKSGVRISLSDTEWCGADGIWRDVWLSEEAPAAARVIVYRDGDRFPAVALYREYVQRKANGSVNNMWSTKASLMLAKVAEALAWRKAFPMDLSGLYTTDEMGQADNEHTTHAAPRVEQVQPDTDTEPAPVTEHQLTAVGAAFASMADLQDVAEQALGYRPTAMADLTADDVDLLLAAARQQQPAPEPEDAPPLPVESLPRAIERGEA